jgi:hypothetical protein
LSEDKPIANPKKFSELPKIDIEGAGKLSPNAEALEKVDFNGNIGSGEL